MGALLFERGVRTRGSVQERLLGLQKTSAFGHKPDAPGRPAVSGGGHEVRDGMAWRGRGGGRLHVRCMRWARRILQVRRVLPENTVRKVSAGCAERATTGAAARRLFLFCVVQMHPGYEEVTIPAAERAKPGSVRLVPISDLDECVPQQRPWWSSGLSARAGLPGWRSVA